MEKYCISLIVLFLTLCELNAQVQIIDIDDKSPIAFVHVISKSGTIMCTSDINGIVDLNNTKENSSTKNDSVIFQHISYENLKIPANKLASLQTISLVKRNVVVPEITVSNKRSEPAYLVLRGYFRSYQIENRIPKYYTDGIVEYYIFNNKLKNRVVQHRSFGNNEMIDSEKKEK